MLFLGLLMLSVVRVFKITEHCILKLSEQVLLVIFDYNNAVPLFFTVKILIK